MKFTVRFSQTGADSLFDLPRHVQAEILATVEAILTHLPLTENKSRVKKLTGPFLVPTHRLRVGDYRVFYGVSQDEVIITKVVRKDAADAYLADALLNPPPLD
jgi:mRNA-degrading endonuclease RelE of RelBE toxin-antitoxin system